MKSQGKSSPPRRDRLIREREHDPYRARRKLAEPTVCPDCHAVFREGRWTWARGPADAPQSPCPACQRVRDRYPAGTVTLSGPFVSAHREEIVGLVRNIERREAAEHPLKRVMQVWEEEGQLIVTTTDLHLARDIGEALHAAYSGELDYDYDADVLRATWSR